MIKTTREIKQANVIMHDGTFYAEDVLATCILSKIFGELTVCRTSRVPRIVPKNVIVYNKEGKDLRKNGVPYGTAGSIWKEYGSKLVANTCYPEYVLKFVDKNIIDGVDANEKGVMPRPKYPAQIMNFAQMIASFNPDWDSKEESDKAFIEAVNFAGIVFDKVFKKAISNANAKKKVEEAIEKSNGQIMVLEKFVPWREFIYASKNPKAATIKFVIFPDKGEYIWQCVPDSLGSYTYRKGIPREWRGLSGKALRKITGVRTAKICFRSGFEGSTGELKDAILMAKIAIRA